MPYALQMANWIAVTMQCHGIICSLFQPNQRIYVLTMETQLPAGVF